MSLIATEILYRKEEWSRPVCDSYLVILARRVYPEHQRSLAFRTARRRGCSVKAYVSELRGRRILLNTSARSTRLATQPTNCSLQPRSR